MQKRAPRLSVVLLSYLGIVLAWSLFYLCIAPWREALAFPFSELLSQACKLLIWALPAFLLIRKYSDTLFFSWETLFRSSFPTKQVSLLSLAILLFCILRSLLSNGRIVFHVDALAEKFISTVLFVDLTEELVFRGWLLNATWKRVKNWLVLLLNALLFLCIHFPLWVFEGSFAANFANGSFLTICLLSLLFSYVFLSSKNIWATITLHMVWNFCIILFFGL
ncbi:MAG: CPBP family intramembrane glutamic endopeptidase [Christensenellaceae bacterium]|jgi:membrane protease YdiL (CAAX protease family)